MKTLLVVLSLLVVAFAMPSSALAKKGKAQGDSSTTTGELKIVQVDAVSITVTVGLSGDEHFTYRITDGTKVTLNSAPVFARDLKAGMIAKIALSPDHSTALSIDAKDAPAHPGRARRVGILGAPSAGFPTEAGSAPASRLRVVCASGSDFRPGQRKNHLAAGSLGIDRESR